VDGEVVYANAAAASLLGARSPAELVGTPVLARVLPEDRPRVIARQAELVRGGVAPLVEERLLRLDGRAVHAEVVAAGVEYDGRAAVLVLLRDVTARRDADAAQRRLTAILEATPDIVADRDAARARGVPQRGGAAAARRARRGGRGRRSAWRRCSRSSCAGRGRTPCAARCCATACGTARRCCAVATAGRCRWSRRSSRTARPTARSSTCRPCSAT
jgi:PAS domain S-box-containing protein